MDAPPFYFAEFSLTNCFVVLQHNEPLSGPKILGKPIFLLITGSWLRLYGQGRAGWVLGGLCGMVLPFTGRGAGGAGRSYPVGQFVAIYHFES